MAKEKSKKAYLDVCTRMKTTRFLNLRRTRRIVSVNRHRRWQATLDKKKFFDKVFGN